MKIQQIRDMNTEDLKVALNDSYEALQNFRFQHSTGQLENYKSLPNMKRDIAKMRTIIKERELKINEKLTKAK
ncbi:MAG: 50S ribosomal protein L29 [bacterium]|nr:50S ribosomal protein L29 [bacterium]